MSKTLNVESFSLTVITTDDGIGYVRLIHRSKETNEITVARFTSDSLSILLTDNGVLNNITKSTNVLKEALKTQLDPKSKQMIFLTNEKSVVLQFTDEEWKELMTILVEADNYY